MLVMKELFFKNIPIVHLVGFAERRSNFSNIYIIRLCVVSDLHSCGSGDVLWKKLINHGMNTFMCRDYSYIVSIWINFGYF